METVLGIDLGTQSLAKSFVRIVAREVGVANEEAAGVVVGIDEPAGDVVGGGAAYLPRRRSYTSTPLTSTAM